MPSDKSQVLSLPYIQPSQAQKHVTHNEALKILDVLVQLVVSSRSTTTPPIDPPDGRRHIVPEGATGGWAGQDGTLAVFQDSIWVFIDPLVGWQAYVKDEDTYITFTSTGWEVLEPQIDFQNLDMVGVNATADTANRLVSAADATLLTHDGNGHQLKVNKAAGADTASLLFQTGFLGRAEMGTAGDDDFSIKVSPDGVTWLDAIVVDAATGAPSFPNGGAGRLRPTAVYNLDSGTLSFASDWQQLTLDTPVLTDPDIAFSAGNFTVQNTGIYTLSGLFAIQNMPVGDIKYILAAYVNGSLAGYLTRGYVSMPVQDFWGVSGSYTVSLAASDVVSLRVFIDTTFTATLIKTQGKIEQIGS